MGAAHIFRHPNIFGGLKLLQFPHFDRLTLGFVGVRMSPFEGFHNIAGLLPANSPAGLDLNQSVSQFPQFSKALTCAQYCASDCAWQPTFKSTIPW